MYAQAHHMKPILGSFAILLILTLAVLLAQKKKNTLPGGASSIPIAEITQADGNIWHNTPRQECRSLVTDSRGRLWTIGVESDGDEERNATRQFISLGRFEDVHWTPKLAVTHPGAVYYPAAAADQKGGLWLAWSEFDDHARTWRVHSAYFDGEKLTAAAVPQMAAGPQVRPAVIVEPDGHPLVVYESGEEHHFVLRAAKFDGSRWTNEVVASTDSNFRPFLALDRDGRTWLAWDRFTQGAYRVLLRSRKGGDWEPEIPFFVGRQDAQRPTLRIDASNTVWVMAGGRLEGIAAGRRLRSRSRCVANSTIFLSILPAVSGSFDRSEASGPPTPAASRSRSTTANPPGKETTKCRSATARLSLTATGTCGTPATP